MHHQIPFGIAPRYSPGDMPFQTFATKFHYCLCSMKKHANPHWYSMASSLGVGAKAKAFNMHQIFHTHLIWCVLLFCAWFLPCCIREPIVNHREFSILNWFSTTPESGLHGCGFCHSYGVNLCTHKCIILRPNLRRKKKKKYLMFAIIIILWFCDVIKLPETYHLYFINRTYSL